MNERVYAIINSTQWFCGCMKAFNFAAFLEHYCTYQAGIRAENAMHDDVETELLAEESSKNVATLVLSSPIKFAAHPTVSVVTTRAQA
jgi:hypothetical protein